MSLFDEVGPFRAADTLQIDRRDRKDMARRARRGPNRVKIEKPWIEKGGDRADMTDRGDAADGKARLRADQAGIGLAERLARDGACLLGADPVRARGDEQNDMPALFTAEDDRLGDLIDLAAHRVGGHLGGARLSRFGNLEFSSRRLERRADPFE